MKKEARKAAQRKFPYLIEHPPNPNCIQIHARSRFPEFDHSIHDLRFAVSHAKKQGQKVHPLYILLNRIRGINSVSPHRYELQVIKAPMFTWDELLPKILKAIQETVAGKRELVKW